LDTPKYKGFLFSYETFFRCTELKKGFIGDGSVGVPAVSSFLGFVDFDDRFFRLFDAFGSF
jgi:hypothetical protein